ncbi:MULTISPECIES: hypothetical protein [Streptomyces]|uniref:DDE superfamily endonuclease n=1 Tax=Streptomyces lonegramiae TaxID=3075524 RepID=A0ABU2XPS5_9ACTN|nr:hypothetical protein [Streptomyces sp. DSM 41529]MDT0547927.1 hypothetical protein [Streptomyces sp. DSM 41529]
MIVLAVLRHDQCPADMAGGNNVPESTVRRWRGELSTLLAAQAPRLDRGLKKVAKQGGEVVLSDGTLIPTQRRTLATGRAPVKHSFAHLKNWRSWRRLTASRSVVRVREQWSTIL